MPRVFAIVRAGVGPSDFAALRIDRARVFREVIIGVLIIGEALVNGRRGEEAAISGGA